MRNRPSSRSHRAIPHFQLGSLGVAPCIYRRFVGQGSECVDTESPYLAFIVALHVATALALIVFFWRDWVRIIKGLIQSIRQRSIDTPDQRLGWLLIIGTIPIGIVGLLLEHTFRTTFGKPTFAAPFLIVNGLMLFAAERLRRNSKETTAAGSDERLGAMSTKDAVIIGSSQIGALAAGISRSGASMTGGLLRDLSHEDAARFSFLLATPVILAAGVLKIPDLFGSLGDGIRMQALAGAACSFVAAYFSVRFLTRYFETKTLTPFAIYCVIAGAISVLHFNFGL